MYPGAKSRGTAGVVGAGVIGLSTAIVAQDAGYAVIVYAATPTMDTTSAKAAASFKPTGIPWSPLAERVLQASRPMFERIASRSPGAGVRSHVHWEASDEPIPAPWYLGAMRDPTYLGRPDVPGGYAHGWRYETFFVDMSLFLRWLLSCFQAKGGTLAPARRFGSLDELAALPHDIVFDCTGLGARALCADEQVIPVRGQVAVIGPRPEMRWSIKHEDFYVYPRTHDTILGGTMEANVWDERVEPGSIDALLAGNRRILPDLRSSDVIRVAAGLRPSRSGGIRIEPETVNGKLIVHNYGHGGAGVTLCWGSAQEALARTA